MMSNTNIISMRCLIANNKEMKQAWMSSSILIPQLCRAALPVALTSLVHLDVMLNMTLMRTRLSACCRAGSGLKKRGKVY